MENTKHLRGLPRSIALAYCPHASYREGRCVCSVLAIVYAAGVKYGKRRGAVLARRRRKS